VTDVVRRRSSAQKKLNLKPSNAVRRLGCTVCFASFYAVEIEPCPVCRGEAAVIPEFGPVPGKFTKATTGGVAHNVVLTMRLPESLADRVDEVRGDMPRSRWLRALVEREVGDPSATGE
jgi:hypothetical protein